MPTRNIVLTDIQSEFVEQLVISGRYQNASEVLREGLRLLQRQEEELASRRHASHGLALTDVVNIAPPSPLQSDQG